MASFHESHVSEKPIETIHPDHLPDEDKHPEVAAAALQNLVEQSEKHADVRNSIHAPIHRISDYPLVKKLIPGIQKVANEYHVGNYVQMRGSKERFFESMPIYPRCVFSRYFARRI